MNYLLTKFVSKYVYLHRFTRLTFGGLILIGALLIANSTYAQSYWTDWATNNPNQHVFATVYCASSLDTVQGIDVIEQSGYGLVNMRLVCGQYISAWAVINLPTNGVFLQVATNGSGSKASGIEVREQPGYGLVNARLLYNNGFSKSNWVTTNQNGYVRRVDCFAGGSIDGIEVKEQYGYGLIDIRLRCY